MKPLSVNTPHHGFLCTYTYYRFMYVYHNTYVYVRMYDIMCSMIVLYVQ